MPSGRPRRGPRAGAAAATALLLLLGAACRTIPVPEAEPPQSDAAQARAAWSRVLARHVNLRGQVDFEALARDPRDLHRFVEFVARTDPERDADAFPTADARLAHHINAYNALSMYGVLRAGIPRTNAGLRKIPFFFLRRYRIGGRSESLYRYESRIRALGDERVHFALNCMSVSCPKLPRVPFAEATLQADLDRLAREFFASPEHLQVDEKARVARVSAILEFYTDDFLARAESLTAYVNRYRAEPIPAEYRLEFLPYDWTINRAQAAPGAGD